MPPETKIFEDSIREAWPYERWREYPVIVAVSGGSDSVAMLRGLAKLAEEEEDQTAERLNSGQLIVTHYNHRWRGDDSDADENFVAGLAESLGLKFVCERADDASPPSDCHQSNMGSGAEAIARDQRYAFLQRAAHQCGARYIATAHNRNDQIETILHRILRGTGISGLRGIPAVRSLGDGVTVVRPLLSIESRTIRDYLKAIDQPFRTDASNNDPDFTRNKIRNEILPYLRGTLGQQLDQNILKLGHHADATQTIMAELCEGLADRSVKLESNATVTIDCTQLENEPTHLICELFRKIWKDQQWPQRDMDTTRWQKLASMVTGISDAGSETSSDPITLPGNVVARKDQNKITLKQNA